MIFEWVINAFSNLIALVLDLALGMVPDPPDFIVEGSAKADEVVGFVAGFGAWVPVGFCAGVIVSVVLCKIIGLTIHFTRIAASFLTFGGGSV